MLYTKTTFRHRAYPNVVVTAEEWANGEAQYSAAFLREDAWTPGGAFVVAYRPGRNQRARVTSSGFDVATGQAAVAASDALRLIAFLPTMPTREAYNQFGAAAFDAEGL